MLFRILLSEPLNAWHHIGLLILRLTVKLTLNVYCMDYTDHLSMNGPYEYIRMLSWSCGYGPNTQMVNNKFVCDTEENCCGYITHLQTYHISVFVYWRLLRNRLCQVSFDKWVQHIKATTQP